MNIDLLEYVQEKLEEFEETNPYDEREIETCMEALATQIANLMETEEGHLETLSDAVDLLEIDKKAKRSLIAILNELQEVMDTADYDAGDDEDKEDRIQELISDFCYILSGELKKLEEHE